MTARDDRLQKDVALCLNRFPDFSRSVLNRPLRRYQSEIARDILTSALSGEGRAFAVIMPRQSGKNEISAQVEAFLLNRRSQSGGQIVKASPTFHPQAANSMLRLADHLRNPLDNGAMTRPQRHIIALGRARALFFSARPGANTLGATADLLLEGDEAQDLPADKWDKDFAPMAASSNAARVLYGTSWTSRTLLAREMRALLELEKRDGKKRVWIVPWERVAEEAPEYGRYVQGEIARLGAEHPLIKTQYLLQEIDEEAGMFPPTRQAQMRGDHPPESEAAPEGVYAMLLDVAGEGESDEGLDTPSLFDWARASRRDYTALTVVRVDFASLALTGYPTYRVVHRRGWLGAAHPTLYAMLLDLARRVWRAHYLVVDATGVGAGLASFLARALGERVIPYVFTQRSKSELGWGFLSVTDMGRFMDYVNTFGDAAQAQFWRELDACGYQIQPGPGHYLRWGVDDPLIHDDFLLSAALCHALDALPWRSETRSQVVEAGDVLET